VKASVAASSSLAHLAEGLACEVREHEPLAPKTSIRAGGAAELYVRPRSPDALVALLQRAVEADVPLHVLGGGANTLVGDGGVPGVTVKLPPDLSREECETSEEGGLVTLGAGAAIVRLVNLMRARGWVGAEFLAGIPGTLGGALAMNAGTKHGECEQVLDSVEFATPEGVGWVARSALTISYRHTALPPCAVALRVRFRLRTGDVEASRAAMEADLGYRKRTQPLSQPNCGSVFQNPPGEYAGRLIEAVGLKGHTLGAARISELHANWIVNLGDATARDVASLIALAQSRVHEARGILLVPEVKRVGVFT
jgi:UDP-N-acetylmuramate dehydrogenase